MGHRGVAQPGSALGLGPRSRRFKSCRRDYTVKEKRDMNWSTCQIEEKLAKFIEASCALREEIKIHRESISRDDYSLPVDCEEIGTTTITMGEILKKADTHREYIKAIDHLDAVVKVAIDRAKVELSRGG